MGKDERDILLHQLAQISNAGPELVDTVININPNSPLECAFSDSTVFLPSASCSFFYLKNYGHVLLHVSYSNWLIFQIDTLFRKFDISGETLVCP